MTYHKYPQNVGLGTLGQVICCYYSNKLLHGLTLCLSQKAGGALVGLWVLF